MFFDAKSGYTGFVKQQKWLATALIFGLLGGLGWARMLIFGGPNQTTYLGCLDCGAYHPESVTNRYSKYGSRYGSESIHNPYSSYGSRYSSYSACNPYASSPPIVRNESGRVYGKLTINRYSFPNLQYTYIPFFNYKSVADWLEDEVCDHD